MPPPAEPQAIRAYLTSTMAAVFDREWEIVLERVKRSRDLSDLAELLNKWRHTAYLELREPGAYYRVLAKAEQVLRTGQAPAGSLSGEEIQARIHERMSREGVVD